jgi:hypothetical protein
MAGPEVIFRAIAERLNIGELESYVEG